MLFRKHFDRGRRRIEERLDQVWALAWRKFSTTAVQISTSIDPQFAVVTVNFSTTRFLKLMLLTLAEQSSLHLIRRIIIVDNNSRDGGVPFLRRLARDVNVVSLVENRHFLNHARGMRSGLAHLDRIDQKILPRDRANVILSCDADIIFRRADTLAALARIFSSSHAAIVGELRHGWYPYPEAQASFLAVRRDCYARPDLRPWVNHGAPAYWLQRSAWQAGLPVVDFPSNHGGYILHRGRSGVGAASSFRPRSSYASIEDAAAHFMGVTDGERVWQEIETRWASLIDPIAEEQLISHLSDRLSSLNS